MKTLTLMLVLFLAALCSACATTSQTGDGDGKLLNAYVQAVEHQAEKRAMKIYWVNPPSERALQRRYGKDNDR